MGRVERGVHAGRRPTPTLRRLFAEYTTLHDHFGRGGNDVMRRLGGSAEAAARGGRRRSIGVAEPRSPGCARGRHLHAELVRYGLVVWTAGNVSARVPGADLLVIKPSGVPYDELTPENMVVSRPRRQGRRGRPRAVVGHRRARLRLPAPARGRRRRAHPLDVRDGVGRARRGRSRAC